MFGNSNLRHQYSPSQNLQSSALIITGVIDGPLKGGRPKAIELYALRDIADLSAYGIGSANNGGGTDGEEHTLSGSAAAGSFITIASESEYFANYFGEVPTYTADAVNINGDDAIELFFNGLVVDIFGEASVDGSGQAWEYMDGWAYRRSKSSPSGTFDIDQWNFTGPNAVDSCTDNDSCGSSFPSKSFVAQVAAPTPMCTCLPE